MSDVELNERIRLDGAEDAERRLGRLGSAAERLARGFGALASVSGLAGLAGLFKIGETVHETDQLYQAVSRVKAMTGLAAENAHAMFDMFELSGIGMEGAENVMMTLARLTERMGGALSGSTEQAQDLQRLMRGLGIAVKAGPEERLYQMADAAQRGKLRIQDLIRAFQIPRSQAAEMMEMLSQGSGRLKKIKEDTLGAADLITESALRRHKEMLQVRRELGDAWGGLVGTLYKNMLPGVTLILNEVAAGFKAIEPLTERVGKVLADNMTIVVGLAKTYLALMIAAKAANVFAPGPALGIFARGQQVLGGANRMMAGRAAAAGSMDYFAARAANPNIGMFATVGGTWTRIFGSVIGRFGVIGVVLGVVAAAFIMLKDNVLGLRDAFGRVFGSIWGTLQSIFGNLMRVFGNLWEAVRPIVALFAGAFLIAIYALVGVIEMVVKLVDVMVRGLASLTSGINPSDYEIGPDGSPRRKAVAAVDAATRGTPTAPATTINQDFRGSKFEITNNFPENVDGGRVAVAVGDELAALGERRLDSGLRPLYSYR